MAFLNDLAVVKIAKNRWKLLQPLSYQYHSITFTAPSGFVSDFASVPRIPIIFAIFGNRAHRAAVIHDYLYSIQYDRSTADKVFLAAMLDDPYLSKPKAYLMYLAVRAFGWIFYKV